MTKFDKTMLVVTVLALIVAIVTLGVACFLPFLTYYKLDPLIKQIKDKHIQYKVFDRSTWRVAFAKSNTWKSVLDNVDITIDIRNLGEQPTRDVVVTVNPAIGNASIGTNPVLGPLH